MVPSGNGVTTVEGSSSASILPGVSSAVRPGVTYSDVTTPFVTPVASSYHVVNPVTHVNPVAYGNKEINGHSDSDSVIHFVPDGDVTNVLSHPISSINYSFLAQAQSTCPDVALMRQSQRLRIVSRPVEGEILLGDVSTGVFRPLLPRAFRVPLAYFICMYGNQYLHTIIYI